MLAGALVGALDDELAGVVLLLLPQPDTIHSSRTTQTRRIVFFMVLHPHDTKYHLPIFAASEIARRFKLPTEKRKKGPSSLLKYFGTLQCNTDIQLQNNEISMCRLEITYVR